MKSTSKPGPKPRWGERSQVALRLPAAHRKAYEQEAARLGISLTEYLVRFLARGHDLLGEPEDQQQEQLPLGA